MYIKATKDLVNQMGIKDFTKNNEYKVKNQWGRTITEINERTVVVKDDCGSEHTLGNWHKHFKIVK